jgi:fumarate reductase subunit D
MKSLTAVFIIGVIVAILDVAGITIFKIMGTVSPEDYSELLTKSLSIIGIVVLVALIIAGIMSAMSRRAN